MSLPECLVQQEDGALLFVSAVGEHFLRHLMFVYVSVFPVTLHSWRLRATSKEPMQRARSVVTF